MSRVNFVLDTSVFIEHIVENAPFRSKAEELLRRGMRRETSVFVIPQVLSETLYVSSRIYRFAGVEEFNEKALEYVMWIAESFNVYDPVSLYVNAGELRKRLGIALTDCYVIASAEALGAKAVFARPEKEMLRVMGSVRDVVLFLAET
ncbi:MAG: type II toxin-antitoxin system VapC family toxin [Candidatus Jordarchaeales archaeon]|nr:type II toxin-antitoxin system VapC family toxin [Candidatus Jordarchaeia archaeon]